MSMHNGMCGHIGPASCDQTLADYIHRKSRTDAFNQVNAEKKKLTFDEWIENNQDASAEAIWYAAQENK